MSDVNKRTKILRTAEKLTNTDREAEYGDPTENFTKVARLWSAYIETQISPRDVAVMLSLLKIARISTGIEKEDNYVDAAGYIALAAEAADE